MTTQNIPSAVPVIEVKKIDKILKRDAKLQKLIEGSLVCVFGDDGFVDAPKKNACKSVGHCAIGALLVNAGYPLKEGQNADEDIPSSRAAKLLKKEYGLLPSHVVAIEAVNDSTSDHDYKEGQQLTRYEEVMGIVSFIEIMQENGVRFDYGFNIEEAYENGEFIT
jgi:hypothetical protein